LKREGKAMHTWFHADAHNQQQGPIDGAALAAA
jgi:hypothetical protein